MQIESLRKSLLAWYEKHQRPLPWRKTKDPYRIWLSEIILQQTRVAQGLAYYQRFVANYPSISELAAAPEERVLKDWEGLGYYSRARNLKTAAGQVMTEFAGEFPNNYQAIKTLKGVGDYTASAVSSFAFGEAQAVLDGNVFRVLSRLYAEERPINTSEGQKYFRRLAQELLNLEAPGEHNQAIMELGALVCKARQPLCSACPWQSQCQAFAERRPEDFPHKEKKFYDRQRHLHYFIIEDENGAWATEQRQAGIWRGLYQFPLLETASDASLTQLRELAKDVLWLDAEAELYLAAQLPKHKLSHQSLFVKIWKLETPLSHPAPEHWQWLKPAQLKDCAFPRPLRRYLDSNQLILPLS